MIFVSLFGTLWTATFCAWNAALYAGGGGPDNLGAAIFCGLTCVWIIAVLSSEAGKR